MLKEFKLINKKNLTNDVFELTFELNENFTYKNWQFITFILAWIWWRAYSILDIYDEKNIVLIIKRLENWRWWSKFICDSQIWDILKWVWPAWHFTLQENNKNKLFLWTWVGFVPLYNQIIWSLEKKQDCEIKFIFWVRNKEGIFYYEELKNIKKEYSNFSFEYFLSKDSLDWFNSWRITNYLNIENIWNFQEFYICWNPLMIDDVVKKLKELWIKNDQIFTEGY